jgi:uncharacterized oxidoreductase
MELKGNTVLVTGGATGIGLAIAQRFINAGSKVIVCGRREEKLKEVKSRFPNLHTYQCDLADDKEREKLYQHVMNEFPDINVLVNNAGVQRRFKLTDVNDSWDVVREEIAINIDALIHLSILFIPHLNKHKKAAIINVSSGLAFVPGAFAPVYSATKAAVHSFTLSLRHQLSNSPVQIIEVAPPAVNTDLGGPGLHTFGVHVDEFADSVMERIERGELEVGYGTSEKARQASRQELDEIFKRMNQH